MKVVKGKPQHERFKLKLLKTQSLQRLLTYSKGLGVNIIEDYVLSSNFEIIGEQRLDCDLRANSRHCRRRVNSYCQFAKESLLTNLRYLFHKSIRIIQIRSLTPLSYTHRSKCSLEVCVPSRLCSSPPLTRRGQSCVACAR